MIRLSLFMALFSCAVSMVASNAVDSVADVEAASRDVFKGGKYIYVPDSLENDVIRLLDGHSKVVDDVTRLDTDELTVYRGDTVPMVLKSLNLGRYDRGLYNFLFIPKRTVSIGLTASYGELKTEDLDLFGLLSDIDIVAHALSIKPYFQYFVRNNLAVGVRLGYYKARGEVKSFDVSIMDDMNFSLHDIMYNSESLSAALTLSQYIGLSRRGRFGVFNEVELAYTGGSSEFQRPCDGELRNTRTSFSEAQLNFSPGVQIFMMRNVAFHVSFGVFGFYFKNERQTENGEKLGNRFSSGANFRFNIFNINFGVAVNI